ncbi:hypothetical protein BKA01_001219 [Pseudonocardia eucalypti]|uniref:hypothetical protein n=1 Tax=Pseudonocardia eucalypti TaxID=648755 RepID=UPI00160782C9|nr:hypothetical protein [Pseudonocardia eucalypti]
MGALVQGDQLRAGVPGGQRDERVVGGATGYAQSGEAARKIVGCVGLEDEPGAGKVQRRNSAASVGSVRNGSGSRVNTE